MKIDGQIGMNKIDTSTEEGKLQLLLHITSLTGRDAQITYALHILKEQGDKRDDETIKKEVGGWLDTLDSLVNGLEPIPGPGEIRDEM